METAVYDMRANLEGEMHRLEKSAISREAKEAIREFLDSVGAKDVTLHRIYFYAVRLRLLAEIMKDDFLKPTSRNIDKLMGDLKRIDSRRGSAYSQNTLNDFKIALKRFYLWKFENLDQRIQETLKKRESKANRRSEDVLSQAEVRLIISNAKSARDKFLIALAYDSGCRISELLTLRIRDAIEDQYGLRIHVTGKTGERKVRCVGDSAVRFSEWKDQHPNRDNADAWLFVTVKSGMYQGGDPLDYDTAQKVLDNAVKRAGISRRIHWHLFRHTRATILARDVKEAPLEAQMGWQHGSKQTKTYVHLSEREVDDSILKAYGVEISEKDHVKVEDLPRKCSRCDTINVSDADYCKKCGMPLNTALLNEIDKKEDVALSILSEMKEKKQLDSAEDKLLDIINSNPELRDTLLKEIIKSLKDRESK